MKILRISTNNNIILNNETDYQTDLGWSENFVDFEEQTLDKVINDIENYETVRYIHEPYSGITSDTNIKQTDIWFYFYFIQNSLYTQNYNAIGLTDKENALLSKQNTESFFRIELYKTRNNEPPNRSNRRLVLAKNLSIPSGERFYSTKNNLNAYVHLPVFVGNTYRNKENMYLFWFQDDTPYNETQFTGNTFWMSAKFFNATNGEVLRFYQ